MLAAVPTNEDRALAMVRLTLQLAREHQSVPDTLNQYFRRIVLQALTLAASPRDAQGQIFPEAIRLALKLRDGDELRADICEASKMEHLSPDVASRILNKLEFQLAPAN